MGNYLLEFLHWRFTAFYIVDNAHIVGYCEGIIAYRLIFFVLSHRMLHQISTKLTPRISPICSTNWNLIISTSHLLYLQGFANSQKTVLRGSRRKLSDGLADRTGASLRHAL